MTFCIGLKAVGCVYLFADTLLSYSLGEAPSSPVEKTSFAELQGEQIINGQRVIVEEGGVKIRTFGRCAITYAGCVKTALALADTVQQCMELGYSAQDALESALISVQPIDCNSSAVLLFACHEGGEAKLFRLDTDGTVEEVSDLVQEGSIGTCHRTNVENMIARCRDEIHARYHPKHHSQQNVLIRIAAILQSLGIHDLICKEGAGGAFVGVCVSDEGVLWQPDTLYVLHPPIPDSENIFVTGLFIMKQVACLIGNAAGINKFIATELKDEARDAREERVLSVVDPVLKKFDSCRFQYLVFLNSGPHIATVLEMNDNLYHALAMLDAECIPEGRVGIIWTEGLLKIVNEIPPDADGGQPDMALWWLPFCTADEKDVAELQNFLTDIRSAELDEWSAT